ncbi:MAG: hypothetical protein JSV24_06715 [Bacteroidales bacterium]|nr:MAG: hypothetical protein JSV24_06715 [Bacteroidales bacterium]
MKKNEVPQDDDGLMEGKLKDLCYAVDENGKYVQVYSTGWEPKNAAMKQAWEEIDKKVRKTLRKVQEGRLSPVAFYMEKNIMNITLLAQYVDLPKRKVRKHLKPDVFSRLKPSILERYASTFDISVEELCNIKKMDKQL